MVVDRIRRAGAQRRAVGLGPWVVPLLLAGCSCGHDSGEDMADTDGETDDDTIDDDDAVVACGGITPDATPLRRMTRTQWANTIHDLLGPNIQTDGFPGSQRTDRGYSTDADANLVSELGAQLIFDAAESVGAQVAADLAGHLPCPADGVDEACVVGWIDALAPRAFRRPLTERESTVLHELYTQAPAGTSVPQRVEMVVAALLQSPQFVYITQGGGEASEHTSPEGEPLLRLTDLELAARLSYLLWETMPDDTLRAVAQDGTLHTTEQLRAAAERMLDDPRAEATIARFHAEWLRIETVASTPRNPDVYPSFDPALAEAMVEQTERFVVRTVLADDGDYTALMSSRQAQVDPALADLYGMTTDASGWATIQLPPERAGLLTHASVLTAHANASSSNPVKRGAFVQHEVMCAVVPPPPPGIPPLGEPGAGQTPFDVLQRHRDAAECRPCHVHIDPPGLAFENFDGIGAWRDSYYGQTIDPAGELPTLGGPPLGGFDDAAGLARLIADSELGHRCYARQWFHYATGDVPER
ncbi:MAG: DUF1592 domain-containing protein, partial [Deltaproteobacteria bacterium]|nr:DUF1592 domain-containing protein [Deltaproteobacteria bacterium]